jgi:hypothetical protein
MTTFPILRPLQQLPGVYEFVAPDVHEIISSLLGLELSVSTFNSLVDVWGPSYCMPTMLIWRDYTYAHELIHPCVVALAEDESAPVLVFGPFLDIAAHQRFRNLFEAEGLPHFEERDSIIVTIVK